MSNRPNMTLWARPAWSADRFVRDFFGPASATDWFKPLPAAFNPAAETAKDGDDAVVRLELPGIDISRDVNVDVEDGRLVVHGERRDEHAPEDPAKDARARSATGLTAGRSPCPNTSRATTSPRPTTPVC